MATLPGQIGSNIYGGTILSKQFVGPPGPRDTYAGGNQTPAGANFSSISGRALYVPPPSSGGQVLGAKTATGGGGDSQLSQYQKMAASGGLNPVQQDEYNRLLAEAGGEAQRREDETRNAINSGYNQYEENLRGLEGSYDQSQTEDIGSASRTYEQIFGGLTEQKTTNLDKLAAGRTAVDTRKAQSIKDLQQNLGNTMRAASMNFGAMGAGDTSATRVMLPYAYTKLAGVQEGSIAKQANEQQFDIDQEERDTNLKFSDMWRQTEIEKEDRINGIKQYYGDAIRNVKTALAQAPLDKSRDLAALSQSLLSEAMSNLRQLEAEDRQRKESVRTWATNRMTQLNDMKLSLANTANFTPQDIVFQELSAGGVTGPTSGVGSDGMYNPIALAQKKRQQYLA